MLRNLLSFLCLVTVAAADSPTKQRIELGTVKWTRDHDAALARAAKTGKPVFVLFQEVPG